MGAFVSHNTAASRQEILNQIVNLHPEIFSPRLMSRLGDTLDNFGVVRTMIGTREGFVPAWRVYRKRSVRYGVQSSMYFGFHSFNLVLPVVKECKVYNAMKAESLGVPEFAEEVSC